MLRLKLSTAWHNTEENLFTFDIQGWVHTMVHKLSYKASLHAELPCWPTKEFFQASKKKNHTCSTPGWKHSSTIKCMLNTYCVQGLGLYHEHQNHPSLDSWTRGSGCCPVATILHWVKIVSLVNSAPVLQLKQTGYWHSIGQQNPVRWTLDIICQYFCLCEIFL